MIGYLRGQIFDQTDGKLVIVMNFGGEAGPAGSIGYTVNIPQSARYLDFLPGKMVELFVYTHVREDMLDLYGFASRMEKELFLTLLSVTGIGPKGALGILTGAEPEQLVQAIIEGDKDLLTQVPGIGKKTAERVVLELKDPMRKKIESGIFGQTAKLQRTQGVGAQTQDTITPTVNTMVRDAKDALIGLGYREQEISTLLNQLMSNGAESPTRVEDLVRTALRQLA